MSAFDTEIAAPEGRFHSIPSVALIFVLYISDLHVFAFNGSSGFIAHLSVGWDGMGS